MLKNALVLSAFAVMMAAAPVMACPGNGGDNGGGTCPGGGGDIAAIECPGNGGGNGGGSGGGTCPGGDD